MKRNWMQEQSVDISLVIQKSQKGIDFIVLPIAHKYFNDPVSFSEAMNSDNSDKWLDAMKDEFKSMAQNCVWDLVELPEGCKRVGCKWVFKTKCDSHGNIERYKARLVAKGFAKKDAINYKETISPVSKKDSFRIIMALVAHYDVYMDQPVKFIEEGKEHMVCKLKRSIYGLKHASKQWYLKFNDTITSFRFEENIVDRCIYLKVSGRKLYFGFCMLRISCLQLMILVC